MRIKVRPLVNVVGLRPGQDAEVDYTARIDALLKAGYLVALMEKRTNGPSVSE